MVIRVYVSALAGSDGFRWLLQMVSHSISHCTTQPILTCLCGSHFAFATYTPPPALAALCSVDWRCRGCCCSHVCGRQHTGQVDVRGRGGGRGASRGGGGESVSDEIISLHSRGGRRGLKSESTCLSVLLCHLNAGTTATMPACPATVAPHPCTWQQ